MVDRSSSWIYMYVDVVERRVCWIREENVMDRCNWSLFVILLSKVRRFFFFNGVDPRIVRLFDFGYFLKMIYLEVEILVLIIMQYD